MKKIAAIIPLMLMLIVTSFPLLWGDIGEYRSSGGALEIGDYATYMYKFYGISDPSGYPVNRANFSYMLIEADMLTRFTASRIKYLVYEESSVYFTWTVINITDSGYVLELELNLVNVLQLDIDGNKHVVNKSFSSLAHVDFKGFTYYLPSGGWVEDWLFWIPGHELLNVSLKFYQPLPMVGGGYVLNDMVKGSRSEFLDLLEAIKQESIDTWGREIRYELREYRNMYIKIGDAIISPVVLHPPPNNIELEVLGSIFTGERLIVGGRESVNITESGGEEEVNVSTILAFYRSHPTHYMLNLSLPEHIFLGIDGLIYVAVWGISQPDLIVYDSVSGLLLYLKDESGIGQPLPPSVVFKDQLNGQRGRGWGIEMVLIDTSISMERPILGGILGDDVDGDGGYRSEKNDEDKMSRDEEIGSDVPNDVKEDISNQTQVRDNSDIFDIPTDIGEKNTSESEAYLQKHALQLLRDALLISIAFLVSLAIYRSIISRKP